MSKYYQNVFQDADADNEEEGGDSIEGDRDMVLEDDPNNDGITKAISEATQEAELEQIAEVEEENECVLANISMSFKTSQESRTESAAEMRRL